MEAYRSTFGFRGLQVEVHCNTSAPLTWLEEFVAPSLGAPQTPDARIDIRLIIDNARYAQTLGRAHREPGRSMDGFIKDGSYEQLAVWRDGDGGEILHSEAGECFLARENRTGAIELIAAADHGLMRRFLMRLVRELAMIQALYRGDVFIHGAAVACRGEAIIVTGARRAGKTTMLINALRQRDVRYLANDRVFVERTGSGARVRGMPTIIAMRPESLGRLPGLKLPQWGHPWRHYLTFRECESGSPLLQPPWQEPPAMNPPQFCRWLGVEIAAEAPLRAVIFPQIDASITSHSLHRHGPADGQALLSANLFRTGETGPVANAFARGWKGDAPSLETLKDGCGDLSRQCAMFTCRLGPAAYESPNVWNAIVSAAFDDH